LSTLFLLLLLLNHSHRINRHRLIVPLNPNRRTRFSLFHIDTKNILRIPPSFHPLLFSPSYSPISSPEEPPRSASPSNSTTSSVEFIEEIHIPPPHPKHYYNYDPHQPLDTLIRQIPQRVTSFPPDSYFIGPDNFDLSEIRTIISGQDPDTIVLVFLPISPFPYDVSVQFFFNLFSPSTVTIDKIHTLIYLTSFYPHTFTHSHTYTHDCKKYLTI